MKTVINNCRRCKNPISSHSINTDTGIYKCSSCNTVASVYDENEYKPDYDFRLAEGMRIEELSNSVKLHIAKPTFMSPDISIKGCLPWLAILAPTLFFTGCDIDINGSIFFLHKIIGALILLGIIKYYFSRLKRPLVIDISPFTVSIYQEYKGKRSHRYLFDSYMIDQVSVTEEIHPSGSSKVYGLQIFTKDGKMHDMFKTFYNVKNELHCIEQFIEKTLCIDDRKVSGEF